MKHRILILFLTQLFVFFFLPQKSLSAPDSLVSFKKQVNENEQKFIHFYFKAESHKLLEEYSEALLAYEKCISLIPAESSPYYQIAKLYLYVFQNLEDAEYYIEEAISASPENEWYYHELLSISSAQKKLETQLRAYERLVEIRPKNKVYFFEMIHTLTELKEYRRAIREIKRVEKKTGISNDLLLALKNVYVAQENFKEAEKTGQQLVKRSPIFLKTLAEIYMHFNDYDSAIIAYTKLLSHEPKNATAIIALHTIFVNKKDIKNQEQYLLKIAINDDIRLEIKKEIFYNLLLTNEYKAYPSFKRIVKEVTLKHPEEPLFNLIIGDIYAKETNYNKPIEHYYLSLNSGLIKDDYIYNKLIEIFWQKQKIDKVLELTKDAIERFPFSPAFYYYRGLAFSSKGEHVSSIASLSKGKDYIIDNDLLVSDFYAIIGNSYHELKNDSLSDEAYDLAIVHNPNNTHVLNNYSYYLSLREEKLDFAKKMITQCLDLTTDAPSASFIDTYAWVLYKLGEYEKAKEQIQKAIELKDDSPVLLDHYGDILYKLGFLKQAKTEWEKAYKLDTTKIEIKKKLTRIH